MIGSEWFLHHYYNNLTKQYLDKNLDEEYKIWRYISHILSMYIKMTSYYGFLRKANQAHYYRRCIKC